MSLDAIRAKLLPKFVTTARERTARAKAALADHQASRVRDEMHAVTGDANMLNQAEIAELARIASTHAKAWESGDQNARDTCLASLHVLSARIDAIVVPG